MAAEEAAAPAQAPFPSPPSARADALSSRLAPQPQPPGASLRVTPPAPDPTVQLEEIDAMLARLHAGARQPLPEPPEPPEEPASDVFELTEEMAAPEPLPAAEFASADDLAQPGDEEETWTEAPAPEEPQPVAVAQSAAERHRRRMGEQVRHVARDAGGGRERDGSCDVSEHALISDATTAAVDSAFNALAQTVLVQNGRTLEDLVREMLRPMLKVWLDDNLPSMVERLVRAEIERVSRGRG
jgi:uncharacterized protein